MARAAAEQAAACAAAAQAAHAELVSMHSAAQSEATALNEAEIAHFAKNVQFSVACIAHTHGEMCALLSLKHQLQHGVLDCACSCVTLHDSATDMGNEDMWPALAQVCASLLSECACCDAEQVLLASEQHQQEQWHCESPSTDTLYDYIVLLADSWLHALSQIAWL